MISGGEKEYEFKTGSCLETARTYLYKVYQMFETIRILYFNIIILI